MVCQTVALPSPKLNQGSARQNEEGDGGELITVTLQRAVEEKGNLGAAVLIFAFFSPWLWCFRYLYYSIPF